MTSLYYRDERRLVKRVGDPLCGYLDAEDPADVEHWRVPRRPRVRKRGGEWFVSTSGFVQFTVARAADYDDAQRRARSWRPCPRECTVPVADCPALDAR